MRIVQKIRFEDLNETCIYFFSFFALCKRRNKITLDFSKIIAYILEIKRGLLRWQK